MPSDKPRSNLPLYIVLWLFGFGTFTFMQVLSEISEFGAFWEKWWMFRASYFFYCVVLMIAANYTEGKRLMEYLRLHHRSKWEEITYVRGFGSGNINHSRAQDFIWYEDDLGDEYLRKLKRNFRLLRVFIWCVFASTGISFLLGVFAKNHF